MVERAFPSAHQSPPPFRLPAPNSRPVDAIELSILPVLSRNQFSTELLLGRIPRWLTALGCGDFRSAEERSLDSSCERSSRRSNPNSARSVDSTRSTPHDRRSLSQDADASTQSRLPLDTVPSCSAFDSDGTHDMLSHTTWTVCAPSARPSLGGSVPGPPPRDSGPFPNLGTLAVERTSLSSEPLGPSIDA